MLFSFVLGVLVAAVTAWVMCISCVVVGAQLMHCRQEKKEPMKAFKFIAEDMFGTVNTAEKDEQQYGYYD